MAQIVVDLENMDIGYDSLIESGLSRKRPDMIEHLAL